MPSPSRLQEQIAISLTRKRARNPRVRIIEVPDRHTDATLHVRARLDARVVIGDLLGFRGGVGWKSETDVEFGDGNVDAESRECFFVCGLICLGRSLTYAVLVSTMEAKLLMKERRKLIDDEVTLKPNTINLDASPLQLLDQILRCGALGTGILNVVVIVVQLHAQPILLHRLGRRFERHGHILLPDILQPYVTRVSSGGAVSKGFVDDIPAIAAIAEMLDESGDVFLEDCREGGIRPILRWAGDPVWELTGPDEIVTPHPLSGGLCEIQEVFAPSGVENAFLGFSVDELKKG